MPLLTADYDLSAAGRSLSAAGHSARVKNSPAGRSGCFPAPARMAMKWKDAMNAVRNSISRTC